METRKNGYYWIKLRASESDPVDTFGTLYAHIHDGWEVAFFESGEGWYSIWDGGSYKDNEVLKINEKQVIPDF